MSGKASDPLCGPWGRMSSKSACWEHDFCITAFPSVSLYFFHEKKKDTLLAKSSLSLKPDARIPVFPRMHLSYPRNRPCVDWLD